MTTMRKKHGEGAPPTRIARRGNRPATWRSALGLLLLTCACLAWTGCAEQVRPPSAEELARFQAADQANPRVDMDRVLQAKITTGPYRATPGDVLKLEMPRFLEQSSDTAAADNRQTYNCRVGDDGTIVLPIVGRVPVRDKSLAEIEAVIAAQYYPKYVAAPLPVYASVLEYKTQRVSIVGAVTQPGIHALRYDQMSLVALLMQAGGIVGQGAAVIRITRANGQATAPLMEDGKPKTVPSSVLRPASYQVRSPVQRAIFEREGPLRTTGWLRVEGENGNVCLREWLDVGNEPQRHEFLVALAARSRRAAPEDLGTRFAQLGAYLEERPMTGDQGPGTIEESLPRDEPRLGSPAKAVLVARRGTESDAPNAPSEEPRGPEDGLGLPPGWHALGGGSFVMAVGSARAAESKPGRAGTAGAPARKDYEGGSAPETETLVLPVRGLNIPFADVALAEGDTIVVEPPAEQSVAVVGLVAKPGNMPYPPGTRYTLIQAIAYAGGLDLVADPHYVSVYRLTPDGEVVSTRFQLVNPRHEHQLAETLALPLKPGDVVSVEHTPRTRMNVFFDRAFRITLGLYVDPLNVSD